MSSSSLRNQTYAEANAPRVFIYDNYVMYDRFMSYKRFNRDNCHCEFEDERDEIQYYRNNYHHFLVLKFSRNTNEMILFDHVRGFLYILDNPIHAYEVDVVNTWNEYHETDMWYIRVQRSLKNAYCLNMINGNFCENRHNNFNGYCDTCQENAIEFDDIDVDRLLTYTEFLRLPEFSDFPDNTFFDELDRYEDNDEDTFERIEPRVDSDNDDVETYFYDNNYNVDIDDRRFGPEDTIEDDDSLSSSPPSE